MKNEQKIYIGITTDNELYYIEIEQPSKEHKNFSMTGTTINLVETEQGERQAREMLEEGDFWKMAVESGKTTLGLDDWVDLVLNTDGWEGQFDFDYDIGMVSDGSRDYYFEFSAGGQHEVKESELKEMFISKEDYRILIYAWKKYHLKKISVDLPTIKQNVDEIIQKFIKIITNDL